MSVRYLSLSQLAEVFGLDRATLRKRLADVKPHREGTKLKIYDAQEVFKILASGVKDINKQLLDEQLRYERARADKVTLEVEKARGEVVPVTEVAQVVGGEYANVRSRLLSIPSRCAKDLSLETDPSLVKQRLDQEVSDALSELVADAAYEEKQNVDQSEDSIEALSSEEPEGPAEA